MASNASALPTWRRRRSTVTRAIRSGWDMGCSEVAFRYRLWAVVPVNDAEHHRYEEQCRDRGEYQTADHRATERRILFAALAETQRHRQHADHHCKRRHQYRAQAHESGFQRRLRRIADFVELLASEADDQHAVRGRSEEH